MVGKSHGAYDIVANVLPDIGYHDIKAYDKAGIVLCDANKGPRVRNLNRKTWHVKHELSFAFNVYQTNRLGGAVISCDTPDLRNIKITDSSFLTMSHWNIEDHPMTLAKLDDAFKLLLR
jgi:hypothetical protein